jgi:uncharacterized protein YdaU (DUF1376 family)
VNFVKLYIGDYLRDTGTLTLGQHGAYMLMLFEHYANEKPLPEGRDLHRLLRADTKLERDAIDFIAGKFWVKTPEGLVNKRAGEEIEKAAHQKAINREIGKRGGRPKRTEPHTESVTESVSETEPNRNPNHSHSQKEEKYNTPLPPSRGASVHDFPPGFDAFWTAYPRKTAKVKAAQAYARLKVDESLLSRMLAALAEQRNSEQWLRDGGQFIPHPASWLNARRWEDEPIRVRADDKFAGAL